MLNSKETITLLQAGRKTQRDVLALAIGTSRYGATNERLSNGYFVEDSTDPDKAVSTLQTVIILALGGPKSDHHVVVDTARIYGNSERLVGRAVSGLSPDQRHRVLVATKVGASADNNAYRAVDESTKRLGFLPHIVFVHDKWNVGMEPGGTMDSFLGQLVRCLSDGQFGALGISNFPPTELRHGLEVTDGQVTLYQARAHIQKPRPDFPQLLAICHEKGLVFFGSSAVGKGEVPNMTSGPAPEIAQARRISLAQLGVYVVRSLGVVPIVQTHEPDHMVENLRTFNLDLPKDDVSTLQRVLVSNRPGLSSFGQVI